MTYDEYLDKEDEELENDEFYEDEDDEEDEEEIEYYDFVEEVRRQGNVIEIKVSAVDICCPAVLRVPVHQTFKLVRELIKLLNKDEIKELVTEVIDSIK